MNMDSKKASELSSEELYALARQREQEESKQQEGMRREKRMRLMDERKKMIARHRKELAKLEREIRDLGGRVGQTTAGGSGGRGTGSATEKLVEIISRQPEMDTQSIRMEAEKNGLNTRNISQTLAYLKRQGRVVSPRRGVYRAA